MTTPLLPELPFTVKARHDADGYVVGMTIQESRASAGGRFRKRRKYSMGWSWRQEGNLEVIHFYAKYLEVRAQLERSPWVPHHRIEHFRQLLKASEIIAETFFSSTLSETEARKLWRAAFGRARELTRRLSELQTELMAEAVLEAEDDTYAKLARGFSESDRHLYAADREYRSLNSAYGEYMESSRVKPARGD